jgi:hypothetical protein
MQSLLVPVEIEAETGKSECSYYEETYSEGHIPH